MYSLRPVFFFITACVVSTSLALACTTAILTGKATKDGRPIIWKQRDTGNNENKLVYHQGEKYRFLGVHDLQDSLDAEVFMGSNDVGFCIINTASYNLVYAKYDGTMDEEGFLMKKALATCRTLADFERLLDETKGKRGVEANFGVIDAAGGAAYYETDPYAFTKFDVNDPKVAPHGYLIRTNFSASGVADKGAGYTRYQTTAELFAWGFLEKNLSVEFIVNEATANLRHSLTRVDLTRGPLPRDLMQKTMVPFMDFVPRYSTTASLIMQGVKEGENPALTTLWIVLGNPLTTPVVPAWVVQAESIPVMMFSQARAPALINDFSLRLKERCFPLKVNEGKNYLDLAHVFNEEGTGSLQVLRKTNGKILEQGESLLTRMRKGSVGGAELQSFYKGVAAAVREHYQSYHIN